ncbi:MAG: metal ABC transporter substrate-binding protein [Desulfobacterales bacterium]|jgi:zinc transport system substrate-binding protein
MKIKKPGICRTIYCRAFIPLLFFLLIQFPAISCLAEKIPVIASIYPVADMVRQVGGDHVTVTCVLPPGASPHTFEPKPSLVRAFSTARIFFMIGAGLEFWAGKFIKQAGPTLMTVVLSRGVHLIVLTKHGHENHPHKKEVLTLRNEPVVANPHIWLDPVIAKSMVDKITAALCKVDPAHRPYYNQRSRNYLKALDRLDHLIAATTAGFKNKKFVAFHASWDYFARRYGLEPAGVIEAAPGRNPTPVQIKNIIAAIRQYHIRAVFAEPQLNPRAAEIIAKEARVRVLLLDPIGGPEQPYGNTYVDLMTHDLNILKEAME